MLLALIDFAITIDRVIIKIIKRTILYISVQQLLISPTSIGRAPLILLKSMLKAFENIIDVVPSSIDIILIY